MKIHCTTKQINLHVLLKQAGYHPVVDRRAGGKISWARTLGGGFYPRFHLYVSESKAGLTFSLHLDQKQATARLGGLRRHAGEYSSPVVLEEGARLKRWLAYANSGRRAVDSVHFVS